MSRSKTRQTPATPQKKESFLRFLAKKEHLYQLLIIFLLYVGIYFLMTSLWPWPRIVGDSQNYIKAAIHKSYDGIRPFGYSAFLTSLHDISPTMWIIVFVQYWINFICTIILVYSIKYFFRPKNRLIDILFLTFSFGSLMVIFLSNAILSDSLFSSLTMLWAAFAIWFIGSRSVPMQVLAFFLHIFVMGFLVNIRFTGFAYIGVTAILIIICFFRKNRLVGVGLLTLLSLCFYVFYNNQCKESAKVSGIECFSGFTGWQKASNALYMWPHVKVDENDIEDPEVKEFVHYINETNFDSVIKVRTAVIKGDLMWVEGSPLRKYFLEFKKKKKYAHNYAWTYLGQNVYSNFGSYMVRTYPGLYFKHFLLPNFLYTFYPTLDMVYSHYKLFKLHEVIMTSWFGKKLDIDQGHPCMATIGAVLPAIRLCIWLLVFTAALFYLFRRKRSGLENHQVIIFWFMVMMLVTYMGTHLLNVPFEIRYCAPLHVMQIGIIYLVVNTFFVRDKKTEGTGQTR